MNRAWIVAATLVLGASAVASKAQEDPRDLVDRVKQTYLDLPGLTATFEQLLDSGFSDESVVAAGTLHLKGNHYRVETESQLVVTDGITVWVYMKQDSQVVVNDYLDDESAFTPAEFLGADSEDFDVAAVDTPSPLLEGHTVVELRPRDADTFVESATLWIREADFIVTYLHLVDINGSTLRFKLDDIDIDDVLAPDLFQFEPTDSVSVIDLRS